MKLVEVTMCGIDIGMAVLEGGLKAMVAGLTGANAHLEAAAASLEAGQRDGIEEPGAALERARTLWVTWGSIRQRARRIYHQGRLVCGQAQRVFVACVRVAEKLKRAWGF